VLVAKVIVPRGQVYDPDLFVIIPELVSFSEIGVVEDPTPISSDERPNQSFQLLNHTRLKHGGIRFKPCTSILCEQYLFG
jgi:hypothetical protein